MTQQHPHDFFVFSKISSNEFLLFGKKIWVFDNRETTENVPHRPVCGCVSECVWVTLVVKHRKKKTERISCRCEKSVDGRYPSPPGDCAVTTFLVYYLERKFFFVKKSSKIEASKMFKLKTTECKFPSKSKTKQWKKKNVQRVAEHWARAPLFLLSR